MTSTVVMRLDKNGVLHVSGDADLDVVFNEKNDPIEGTDPTSNVAFSIDNTGEVLFNYDIIDEDGEGVFRIDRENKVIYCNGIWTDLELMDNPKYNIDTGKIEE